MTATAIERRDFTDSISKEFPKRLYSDVRDACRSIMRWAGTYCRLQEAACNRELTTAEDRKDGRCEERIRELCAAFHARWQIKHDGKVIAVVDCDPMVWFHRHCAAYSMSHALEHEGYSVAEVGVIPVFNGDPRGATVKLRVPFGRTDDWGEVGLCVPTS